MAAPNTSPSSTDPPRPSTDTPIVDPGPWDYKLRSEFEDVANNSTDESEWYGPWDTAIHRLFKDQEGFQVAPQHLNKQFRGKPEWTIFYLIKAGSIPVCVFEIKPYRHLKGPQKRIDAYYQVAGRLRELLVDEHPIPTMYGVSVIGERFLIMTINTTTGMITPALAPDGPEVPLSAIAPLHYWRNQVLKRLGVKRLNEMVTNVKYLCRDFPPRAPPAMIVMVSNDIESDTSSMSSEDPTLPPDL